MNTLTLRIMKTIKITNETHARLLKHGNMDDSFDDGINRPVDHYEKTHKPSDRVS